MYKNFRTIAAISTPIGQGGIAGIRISGEDSFKIAKKVFFPLYKKDLEKMDGYTAAYGSLVDFNEDNLAYDNGICVVYKNPRSYTGEDIAEIFCHGGIFVAEKTLGLLIEAGAVPATAGEFTKRAYLNGKIDLNQAESVMDIITASSDFALKMAMSSREGKLSKETEKITKTLLDLSAFFGAWFDYPEEGEQEKSREDIEEILKSTLLTLEELIKTYHQGKLIKHGVPTVIVGRPNVGKSTLMNLLLREERSIVTEIPGTTRDVIEESVRIGNITLKLSDTAGIRESEDIVEQIGVRSAYKKIDEANLILAIFDATEDFFKLEQKFLEKLKGRNVLCVLNKIDKIDSNKVDLKILEKYFSDFVFISAKEKIGIKELEEKILEMLSLSNFDPMGFILSNKRQYGYIIRAKEYLEEALNTLVSNFPWDMVSISLEAAVGELLELSGKTAGEEIVNNIFEQFCVGK